MSTRNAKQKFYCAIDTILMDRTIDKICVNDIIREAGTSRSTFYRHYYDKYALVRDYYNFVVRGVLEKNSNEDLVWIDGLILILKELESHSRYYRNAIQPEGGLHEHIEEITRHFYYALAKYHKVDLAKWKHRAALEAYTSGTMDILVRWIMEGMPVPAEEFSELLETLFPFSFSIRCYGWKVNLLSGLHY